jgi:hypothetical protein
MNPAISRRQPSQPLSPSLPHGVVMSTRLSVLVVSLLSACLISCDCELPDRWKGASLDGCSEAGDIVCCSYSDDRCSYTVCQDVCGEPEQTSWACF